MFEKLKNFFTRKIVIKEVVVDGKYHDYNVAQFQDLFKQIMDKDKLIREMDNDLSRMQSKINNAKKSEQFAWDQLNEYKKSKNEEIVKPNLQH